VLRAAAQQHYRPIVESLRAGEFLYRGRRELSQFCVMCGFLPQTVTVFSIVAEPSSADE